MYNKNEKYNGLIEENNEKYFSNCYLFKAIEDI